jgi:hypothetical protein
MESKSPFEGITLSKILWGVVAVVGVGAAAVMMQGTERQAVSDQFVLTTKLLSENARSACSEALRNHFGADLDMPDDSVSDGDTKVTLKWRSTEGKYNTVDCTYALDQGVVGLTVDGKAVANN